MSNLHIWLCRLGHHNWNVTYFSDTSYRECQNCRRRERHSFFLSALGLGGSHHWELEEHYHARLAKGGPR